MGTSGGLRLALWKKKGTIHVHSVLFYLSPQASGLHVNELISSSSLRKHVNKSTVIFRLVIRKQI